MKKQSLCDLPKKKSPNHQVSHLPSKAPRRFNRHFRFRKLCEWNLREEYAERLKRFSTLGVAKRLHGRAVNLMDAYGEIMLRDLDYETALSGFLSALSLAPNQVKCHNNLAVFYWEHGEHKKAVNHLEKALNIDPDDRETVWNCGQVMSIVGEPLIARYTYVNFMNRNGYDEEMAGAIDNF